MVTTASIEALYSSLFDSVNPGALILTAPPPFKVSMLKATGFTPAGQPE
jgi:hypothetical protein